MISNQSKSRFELVCELARVQKAHTELWSLRSIESEKQKQQRLALNRKRKSLQIEIEKFQPRFEGF